MSFCERPLLTCAILNPLWDKVTSMDKEYYLNQLPSKDALTKWTTEKLPLAAVVVATFALAVFLYKSKTQNSSNPKNNSNPSVPRSLRIINGNLDPAGRNFPGLMPPPGQRSSLQDPEAPPPPPRKKRGASTSTASAASALASPEGAAASIAGTASKSDQPPFKSLLDSGRPPVKAKPTPLSVLAAQSLAQKTANGQSRPTLLQVRLGERYAVQKHGKLNELINPQIPLTCEEAYQEKTNDRLVLVWQSNENFRFGRIGRNTAGQSSEEIFVMVNYDINLGTPSKPVKVALDRIFPVNGPYSRIQKKEQKVSS